MYIVFSGSVIEEKVSVVVFDSLTFYGTTIDDIVYCSTGISPDWTSKKKQAVFVLHSCILIGQVRPCVYALPLFADCQYTMYI